ncbi:hypothetical protein HY448_00435 [Candidatus Pacearchaeota archaeon]|nr:hypothetical protein [Candidatus Pacearchaeota archaeon]
MDKWTELLLGLLIVIGIVYFAWASSFYGWTLFGKNLNFLRAAWEFLKGGIFWLAMMIGVALILLGINDLRE